MSARLISNYAVDPGGGTYVAVSLIAIALSDAVHAVAVMNMLGSDTSMKPISNASKSGLTPRMGGSTQ